MATTKERMHPAIQRYLTELETKLRQTPGVAPEEGLADAREFLLSEWEELSREGTLLLEDDVYRRFVEKFGSPDEVAGEYAQYQEPAGGRQSRPSSRKRRWLAGLTIAAACALIVCGYSVWTGHSPPFAAHLFGSEKNAPVWAGRVVSFVPGNPIAPQPVDPEAALGPPDCQDHSQMEGFVALGQGGTLVVEFVDAWLCDRPGADLKIVEIGPLAEPFEVAVSRDGKQWIDVGRAKGAESEIDLAPFVRPGDRFRFVRIVDAKGINASRNRWPGADIDAVGALHSVPYRQITAR
jgi:hypothetical protein